MILSTRGVTIPIYLVSSTTDSIRRRIVLFKPVTVLTSDPKSEFLCQSSLQLCRTYRPPESPHMPGISPTPLSSCIIRTVNTQVLLQSTSSISCALSVLNVLVAASKLKSSRVFHSNITVTQAQAGQQWQLAHKINNFLSSLRITDIPIKSKGGNNDPHYNVYMDNNTLKDDQIWSEI